MAKQAQNPTEKAQDVQEVQTELQKATAFIRECKGLDKSSTFKIENKQYQRFEKAYIDIKSYLTPELVGSFKASLFDIVIEKTEEVARLLIEAENEKETETE